MKKIIFVFVFLLFCVFQIQATINIKSIWESNGIILTLSDNYGTPLSEKMRARAQREKAYHIFNLLCNTEKETKFNIVLSGEGSAVKNKNKFTVSSLDIKKIEEKIGRNISKPENYRPIYERGELIYQRWVNNSDYLIYKGEGILSSEDGFFLLGKYGKSIIVNQKGKLIQYNKGKWKDIESLKGFTCSKTKKINKKSLLSYVERNSSGKKFLAIISLDGSPGIFLPSPQGYFLNAVATRDLKDVYCLTYGRGSWNLYHKSTKSDNKWTLSRRFGREVYLMGIRDSKIFLWDPGLKKLFSLDGIEIKGFDTKTMELYPRGRYIYGEEESSMKLADPVKKIILFYGHGVKDEIKEAGLREVEKFKGSPEVWVFPENFKTVIDMIPQRTGHVYFSEEDMKVYFDKFDENLRKIGNVKLRPTIPKKYILAFLGVLLLILVFNDIFKKTKEYTK